LAKLKTPILKWLLSSNEALHRKKTSGRPILKVNAATLTCAVKKSPGLERKVSVPFVPVKSPGLDVFVFFAHAGIVLWICFPSPAQQYV